MANENSALACAAGTALVVYVGVLVGLNIEIWACLERLEPAFNATTGINDKGAKGLAALVDIASRYRLEFVAGAGTAMVSGVISLGVAVSILACCNQLCSQRSRASIFRSSATPSPFLFQRPVPETAVTTRQAAYTASMV